MSRSVIAFALPLALPWLPGLPPFLFSLLNAAAIAAIVALGLVILTGNAGMTSFAQASFMGVGAYATALLTTEAGLSPWLGLPAALAASAIAAVAIGAITLRLSGHYLALATIAWSVSLYYVAANLDALGRNDGIIAIPPLTIDGSELRDSSAAFPVVWLALALSLIATRNLLESRSGRALRALARVPSAAAACGVRTAHARMLAFVVAAVLAGLAGWLFAHLQRSVNPTPFGLAASIEFLLMAVLGGAVHPAGALVGAVMVTLANDLLQDWIPRLFGSGGNFETIAFGVLLIAGLQMAPEGIWPHLARPRRGSTPTPDALATRPQPEPGGTLLRVERLTRRFGGVVAVNQVSFMLAAGEILGLIGPNGAGKSTTFHLLTGLLAPDSGAIWLGAERLAGLPPWAIAVRRVGRTFQHVRLVAELSVLDNIALGAHLRGRAGPIAAMLRLDWREERRLRADAMAQLARVGLTHLADRPVGSLALGQQRLVEVARALALDPVLLLLDEPAAGLRHAEKQALAALLRRLRTVGITVLLVEHDMDFVMGLADRLVVLDFGERLAEGAPAKVRTDPAVIEAYLGSVA
jgi:branched-chain amino acid transport system permease protein